MEHDGNLYWSDRAELKGVKQPNDRLFHAFQPFN